MIWPPDMPDSARRPIASAARRFARSMPPACGDWQDIALAGIAAYLSAPEQHRFTAAWRRMLDFRRMACGRRLQHCARLRASVDLDAAARSLPAPDPSPARSAQDQELAHLRAAALQDHLAQQRPSKRLALLRALLSGSEQRAAARRLGIAPNNGNQIVASLRRHFQDHPLSQKHN